MKKSLILFTVTALASGILTACGSSGTYDKYVKLGDYKGIELTKIKPEVTDESLQDEIDTTDVTPLNHVMDLQNVFREDIVHESMGVEKVLSNAPSENENMFQVPKIV